jgi:hypothetical protein
MDLMATKIHLSKVRSFLLILHQKSFIDSMVMKYCNILILISVFCVESIYSQSLNHAIVYFLNPECKLCKSKAFDIQNTISNNLKNENPLQIYFVFHDGISKKEANKFVKMFGKNKNVISTILDKDNKLAIVLDAKTTPSVYLIDNQNRTLYSGALDDKDVDVVKSKKDKSISYIDQSIIKYQNNQEIEKPFIMPVGCVFR